MTIRLGVVMDPIATINFKKDSTFAMLLEAQKRQFDIYYFEQADLFVRDGKAYGSAKRLHVELNPSKWYEFGDACEMALSELDIILMRKDPPFNENYIYTTYLLELAEKEGVLVANKPQSLRDANEKFFISQFPACTVPTLITQDVSRFKNFLHEHKDIVCKPLNGMGGHSIFRLQESDHNVNAIFNLLTHDGHVYVMAQTFIKEVVNGDKRIIMIDGEPISYALARIPQGDEWRGNLALGAKGKVQPLTDRDRWIAAEVGPTLKKMGLYFVGLDVIGDYLTEINVTSPTGIREIDAETNMNVSKIFFDKLMSYCHN